MSERLTEAVTALLAALGGPDGAALDARIAALPVERALEIGLFLARVQPGVATYSAQAASTHIAAQIAERIYAALRPLAGQRAKLTDDLAQLALSIGRADEATALLEEQLRMGEALGRYQTLARALIALGDRERAERLAVRLQEFAGPRVTGWQTLAELALAFEGEPAAEQAYRRVLAMAPNSNTARLGMAQCMAARGDAEDAREHVAAAFAAYGDSPSAWVLRETCEVARRLGDTAWEAELRAQLDELDAREAERLRGIVTALTAGGDARLDAGAPRRLAFGTLSVARARAFAASPSPMTDDEDDGEGEPADEAVPAVEEEEPPPEALDALRETFGHEDFLPGQATIVRAVLAGEDVLALMPTGAGKSLCYQLPALLLPGVTVLISPLIALMKDQVEGLPEALRERATIINSLVEREEVERRLGAIGQGAYKLVYAAPERLRQQSFIYALRRAGVSRFMVDEAHCVSLWGHDFRPDYLFIAKALRRLEAGRERVPVLALTATATPEVRAGIAEALGRDLRVVNRGVYRPNLRYAVIPVANNEQRLSELARIVAETPGCGIVYVRSREGCEEVAEFLRRRCRIAAVHYHAGMARDEREAAQDDFIAGRARVVVATVAFGMGIDKPDVRFIVHYQLPGSLEAYVQESGRAGRDGKPSRCVLFVSPADASALRRHVSQDELSIEALRAVYAAARALVRQSAPPGTELGRVTAGELERDIAAALQASGRPLDETAARVALSLLERAGFIRRHPDVPRSPGVRIGGERAADPVETSTFQAFLAAAGLQPGQLQPLDLVGLAARLGQTPAELEERLLGWRDDGRLELRESGRDLLLEMCPPPADGREALPSLLEQVAERHARQVGELLAYTRGAGCRQRTFARHFGERLPVPACGTCDNCAPAADEGGRSHQRGERQPRIRDEEVVRAAVLACLRELPYAVGVSGLVKILRGSPDVSATARRVPQYGALAAAGTTLINRVVLAMIAEGVLERDAEAQYPTLRVRGA